MSQLPEAGSARGGSQLLHVHDLPQLYTRPSADSLLRTLQILQKPLSTFGKAVSPREQQDIGIQVDPDGVPRYLTSIIASPLDWIAVEQREPIWELASERLSERSGRSAAKDTTRAFTVQEGLVLDLHEPSLTEDSLGLKTWTSSLLLARRLNYLVKYLDESCTTVLELGAGTGLVGLAAASVWRHKIRRAVLTDLPAIVPNLQHNIEANAHVVAGVDVEGRVLDWSEPLQESGGDIDRFSVLVAADPIYGPDHPRMLVDTIRKYIASSRSSIFILELPVRGGYMAERSDLVERLSAFMVTVEEGHEVGYDDWEGADGQPAEVECWWSVWKLR